MGPLVSLALEGLLALLAPPRCAGCDAPVHLLAVFCPSCASTAVRIADEGPGLPAAALVYGGAVARAIGRMKYEGRPDLARPLGDLLWRALQPHAAVLRGVVVVPVPLHVTRLVERGFNQSALLAGRLAARLGAPFRPGALARTRATGQQAALDRAGRITNVAGAFSVRHAGSVRARTVLLVDDVTTTGATLDACEHALASAGIARVQRIALASAPQRVEEGGKDRQALRAAREYHAPHP
jgi:ComF family protein